MMRATYLSKESSVASFIQEFEQKDRSKAAKKRNSSLHPYGGAGRSWAVALRSADRCGTCRLLQAAAGWAAGPGPRPQLDSRGSSHG